jgi:hypothetical protein
LGLQPVYDFTHILFLIFPQQFANQTFSITYGFLPGNAVIVYPERNPEHAGLFLELLHANNTGQ